MKFMNLQYMKCFELAKDEKFKHYLKYLQQSFDLDDVNQFCNFLLTVVSLPQFVNSYKFLADVDPAKIQQVIATENLTQRMTLINSIFSDFVKKIELWGSLEDEHDFRKDQIKAQ